MNFQNDFSTMQHKEFTSKQLAEMIKYCEDKCTCRRQFQLRYLGETDFDPATCAKTCDNCKRGSDYLDFECIEEGRALVRLIMLTDRCYVSISKTQLIGVIRGKADKNFKYKLEKLEHAGADLYELRELFKPWKDNEIENLLLELLSADILTEKVVKTQIMRNNKGSDVINLYLKSNQFRSNAFLQRVQSLPLKRYAHRRNAQVQETVEEEEPGGDEEGTTVQEQEQDEDREKRFEKYRHLLEDIFEDENDC
jgi:superfamily II DNA helicase RecQ